MQKNATNRLAKLYMMNNSMKSIKNNNLLLSSGHGISQNSKVTEPEKIREVILDQHKVDSKINPIGFNEIVDKMKSKFNPEREKLWSGRNNQPYKTITPAKDIKKEYKTRDELIIYKVRQEDKDKKKFEEKTEKMQQDINEHNKELSNIFTSLRKKDYEKEFEYNNVSKYGAKFDPTTFDEMKDDVVDYYKKEQEKIEKDKTYVENIEKILESDGNKLSTDIPISSSPDDNSSQPDELENRDKKNLEKTSDEKDDEIIDTEKYTQRQKKI